MARSQGLTATISDPSHKALKKQYSLAAIQETVKHAAAN